MPALADSHNRVLVVDDQPIQCEILKSQLSDLAAVDTVHGGEDALVYCEDHSPDLIVMDIEMPRMNGIEACAKLRHKRFCSSTPLVFLSSNNDTRAC